MEKFVTSLLASVPADKAKMRRMVSWVEKLPAFDEDLIGMVCHLTASQPGCTVGHFYMMTKVGSTFKWVDLTSNTDIVQDTSLTAKYGVVELDYRNQLAMTWKSPADAATDKWVCDLVVSKEDGIPANIRDGHLLCASYVRNEFDPSLHKVFTTNLISTDLSADTVKHVVFHVFESGRTTYSIFVLGTVKEQTAPPGYYVE